MKSDIKDVYFVDPFYINIPVSKPSDLKRLGIFVLKLQFLVKNMSLQSEDSVMKNDVY